MEQKGQTGEIVMYQPDETIRLEVRMDHETVWLNRQQMAALFDRDIKTIGKHINNALREELRNLSTVAKFAIVQPEGTVKEYLTVQTEGNRNVIRKVKYYKNRQVKRNIERFPEDFMFQLTKEEYNSLRCHFGTSNRRGGDRRALPYAFTQHRPCRVFVYKL